MFLLTTLQAHLHGLIKPGDWFEFSSCYHSASISWEVLSGDDSSDIIAKYLERLRNCRVVVVKVTKSTIILHKFSNVLQYMSVITITFEKRCETAHVVSLRSVSSSPLPTWFPLGFLVGICLSWFPFRFCFYSSYHLTLNNFLFFSVSLQ